MDTKIAFYNVNLDEQIYMGQPIGFLSKEKEDKVCRLKRSIYVLKKSSRSWYIGLHGVITSFGLSMASEDHSVYVKKTIEGIIFLILYVNDILLAGNNFEMTKATTKWLSYVCEMKDVGRFVL